MRDFKNYNVWQLSREFCKEIYEITKVFPNEELYGITSQIRRASISIPTNISEGCGRISEKEFKYFLNIALGSAHEVENLLILSNDFQYITNEQFEIINENINLIKKKLYHLIQKIN